MKVVRVVWIVMVVIWTIMVVAGGLLAMPFGEELFVEEGKESGFEIAPGNFLPVDPYKAVIAIFLSVWLVGLLILTFWWACFSSV